MDENANKKYQEIIDKYATDMGQKIIPSPQISLPPAEVKPMISERSAVASPDISSESTPVFIKFLFFVSLLVFLGVLSAIGYNLYRSMSDSSPVIALPTALPSQPVLGETCLLNDTNYQIDESFPSADGCNTCSCTKDLTITCTDKACDVTPVPSTQTPTEKLKITPTVIKISDTGPLKDILASVNKSLKTNYQEITLDNGKSWSVNLTKSHNKTNILTIKKAITSAGLGFQEDLSGESGQDWKEVYTHTADICDLQYSQGVLTLTCHN